MYLNGKLDVEMYMKYPEGMTPKRGCDTLRLLSSLYGLKQSGRTWWIELGKGLKTLDFKRLESDWGLYCRQANSPLRRGPMMLLAYVDDLVVAARLPHEIDEVMKGLKSRWKITELGEISTILGMKVTRDRKQRKIWLTQTAYIDKLLDRFPDSSKSTKPRGTPMNGRQVDEAQPSHRAALTAYQEVVGCLQWIATCTRPDISFTSSYLARYLNDPTDHQWQTAMGAVSYLLNTKTVGLTFGGCSPRPLEGWVDSDHGGCVLTRRSTTGWVFELNGSIIAWSSKRQATVSTSTSESEYVAVSEAAKEAVWLRGMLEELGCRQPQTSLHGDNQGSIHLANRPAIHSRTKHIDIRHHPIERGMVKLDYVPTADQKADVLTKALPRPRHESNLLALRLARPVKGTQDLGTRRTGLVASYASIVVARGELDDEIDSGGIGWSEASKTTTSGFGPTSFE